MFFQNGEGGGKCSISIIYLYFIVFIKMGELVVYEDWYFFCDRDQIFYEFKKIKVK